MRAEERTSSLWITLAEPPRNVLDIPKIRALQEALAPLSTRRERKVEEAYRLGLVTRVVEDLESETEASVQTLAGKSAVALSAARKALRRGEEGSFAEALARTEAIYRDELLATEDAEEGVRAFPEKRPPHWRNR